MYANTTNGHREHVNKSKDSRVVLSMLISGTSGVIVQTTETTIETWTGLNYTDANGLLLASETSNLNGTPRNYLGGAKLTVGSGGVSAWNTIEHCWGTKVSSSLQRMGDTNLYAVQRTT